MSEPRRRVVLLGASNVARGLPTILRQSRRLAGGAVDLLSAAGYGRSYGWSSRVFFRRLPSILTCGLWRTLDERPAAPTWGLVADVGNDILYGASVDAIVGWVDECLDRLAPRCERLIVTELPLESVGRMGESRYVLMRSLLFPKSTVSWDAALARADAVNAGLRRLASARGATLARPRPRWYGLDPIHIRWRWLRAAWSELLSSWGGESGGESDGDSDGAATRGANGESTGGAWCEAAWLRTRRPWEREVRGVVRRTPQPAAVLSDGSRASLY